MKKTYSESRLFSIGIMGMDRGEGVTALAVGLASYLQIHKTPDTFGISIDLQNPSLSFYHTSKNPLLIFDIHIQQYRGNE